MLLLDCYPPTERSDLLKRAFGHHAHVWILRQVVPGDNTTKDSKTLINLKAQQIARLPKGSLAIHQSEFWAEAQFDAYPTQHAVEIWRLGRDSSHSAFFSPAGFQQALGNWEDRREDFHWPENEHPVAWDFYRDCQQDAVQTEYTGLSAAIDGRVDLSLIHT